MSTTTRSSSDCRKFTANIFNKSKCSHCFRQREEHSAAALECNRVSRKVSKCGYLFVAPDWDFSNPLYRTKRWQRRWFVLYDDGEFTYSVDDHPETIPQACIDMTKVLDVATAEDQTGHVNSLSITAPDRVTFVKGTCPEEAKWWLNILLAYPKAKGRHKRNATFPGGQTTSSSMLQSQPSIMQTGRNQYNLYHKDTSSSITTTTPPTISSSAQSSNLSESMENNNENLSKNNNRDPLRDEKLKDIANTITNIAHHSKSHRWSTPQSQQKKSTLMDNESTSKRDENSFPTTANNTKTQSIRPKSLQLLQTTTSKTSSNLPSSSASTIATSSSSTSTPSIVSAIAKKMPAATSSEQSRLNSLSSLKQQQHQSNERGDPDGGCNLDEVSVNYLSNSAELRAAKLPVEEIQNSKKGWLMKQESRTGDWSKHWFTLRGAALFFYSDPIAEERGELEGVLDVNGLTTVAEIPVARNYGFQLTTWDNRRIVLSTVSANTRNNWLNVLRSAAGLSSAAKQQSLTEKLSIVENCSEDCADELIIKDNTSDDLKSEIEKDFIKAQRTHQEQQNFMNSEILISQSQSSSPLSSITIAPIKPKTPKSMLFSSDEEYRTASEGGRRDSVDWGSPLSPSSPIPLLLARTKERIQSTSSDCNTRHKRSRSSPPASRRSTIDSGGGLTDRPIIHSVQEELNIDKEIQLRLVSAEKELNALKEEANDRESRTTDLLSSFERTELTLTNQIREVEEARDTLARQLNDNRVKAEQIIACLSSELEETQVRCKEIENRLSQGIEENETLYKKIRDLEGGTTISLSNLNRSKIKRVDSLSDLTSLSDIDPYCLDRDMLADEYQELKSRFEKAVNEIRAMKKELKESQNEYDHLEIQHASLRQDLERKEQNDRSNLKMMAERIQDLTLKYSNSDRQVRMLKQKLTKSEKRRSLSLKGREQMSVAKELEDKVADLEAKIDALETSNTDAAVSIPSKPITSSSATEEREFRRASARLRRKSLDSNPPEAVQVMLRLSTLEKRVEKATAAISADESSSSQAKNESSATILNNNNNNSKINNNNINSNNSNTANTSPKISEHLIERLRSLEGVVITSKERIEQGLQQLQCLKSSKSRRSVSPIADRKDSYRFVERCLSEAAKILRDSCENCVIDDCLSVGKLILLPESNSIKLALLQLEAQLRTKLNDLLKQRRVLRERNELSPRKSLELLAERIAYESVCFGKLRDAINRAEDPTQFGEKQTRAEAAETSLLMSMLKAKLSGKSVIKPSGSLDVLASVLARRLMLTTNRTGHGKVPEMTPINANIMDELLQQQNELQLIAKRYKNNAMENLACGLAAETLSYISSNDAVQGAVQEAWRQAQEAVNAELVQTEIAHIMLRNSTRFENSITPSFGYTLTSQERISFENFADAVQDALRKEMDMAIGQLTQYYEESLSKMKRGQWRLHLEQERKASEGRQLLAEFADIVAHKALVDARISVLNCEYIAKDLTIAKDTKFSLATLQKYENLFAELAADLQISNPDDILAEADFNFMYKYFTSDSTTTNKNEIHEVSNNLQKLEQTIVLLQSTLNPNTSISMSKFEADNLNDICNKCQDLQDRIEPLIPSARTLQASCDDCDKLKNTLDHLNEQHDLDLDDLRKSYQSNCDTLKAQLNDQLKITRALEAEKHQVLNELSIERDLIVQREEELHAITKKLKKQEIEYQLKDDYSFELTEHLEVERQRSAMITEDSKILFEKYKVQTNAYNALLQERDYIQEQLDKERDRVRKLERRLELLQAEQSQQIESLHAAYKEQQLSRNESEDRDKDEEATFKLRYQAEIEQLRTLCEKGLVAMESSHRRIIKELEEKHRQEIQRLLCEKEQALAEETQATLAALDAMRKAHQSEVQREVTRFKAEFVRQFQKGGPPTETYKGKEEELDEVRVEILSLSEKYSTKCVEAATLEEKCRLATHQLKHFQQHVQQLENRNKQLRAHIVSEESDYSCYGGGISSKESSPTVRHEHEDAKTSFCSIDAGGYHLTPKDNLISSSSSNIHNNNNKKEIHPRLNFNEGIKLASIHKNYIDKHHVTKNSSKTPTINKNNIVTTTGSSSPLEEITTKIYSPKITTMKLRSNGSILRRQQQQQHINATINNNNNDVISNDNNTVLKLQCSPPPLDVKDVEHIRRFELEI